MKINLDSIIRCDRIILTKQRARATFDHFTVHETAREVLENEFLYTITLEKVDGRNGVIQARTAKDHKVKVESQREGANLTLVLVYVGPMGDEAAQVDIFNRLEMKLKETVSADANK